MLARAPQFPATGNNDFLAQKVCKEIEVPDQAYRFVEEGTVFIWKAVVTNSEVPAAEVL